MKHTSSTWRRALTAGALLIAGVTIGLGLAATLRDGRPAPTPAVDAAPSVAARALPEVPSALEDVPRPSRDGLETPFTRVAERSVPAVVSVEVLQRISAEEHRGLMRRFRGDSDEPDTGDEDLELPSSGTGFIFDPSGLVLTNDHVVTGVTQVELQLADGRYFTADLVGTDPGTDVAVLRIRRDDLDSLPWIPLGNSDDVRVGDWAIAVGNPLGELAATVTVGVVSAVGRHDLRIAGGGPMYQDFVQTDASINFGNSGGPLLNVRGEVVAINSAINPTGQGIGFAIPINMVREVAIELIRSGTVRRAYLGVRPMDLTRDVREEMGLDEDVLGILVQNVEEGTPAAESGLREGDVITSFAGEEITDAPQFRAVVAATSLGQEVEVGILRSGQNQNLQVRLVERPDTPEPPETWVTPEMEDWFGAEVQEITPEGVSQYELTVGKGLLVTTVHPSTPADRGGLRAGDILLLINGEQVDSDRYLRKELDRARSRGRKVDLLVQRGNETRSLEIQPG